MFLGLYLLYIPIDFPCSIQPQNHKKIEYMLIGQGISSVCTGNSGDTKLFDGEPDHLVPSSSAFLVESDLFLMAGRMIGHCFLHGGPALTGLSPAIVHILCGGTVETAIIQINDCPDIDLREKITLVCILQTAQFFFFFF